MEPERITVEVVDSRPGHRTCRPRNHRPAPRGSTLRWIHAAKPLVAIALLVLAALLIPPPAGARAQGAGLTPQQRKAVEEVVREYLLKNPEIILDSVRTMEARQRAAAEDRVRNVIATRAAELFRDPGSPVAGNPDGDVTLVEFFDYQCGFCKRVYPVLKKLLKEDGNVRFVYKEFPILGATSVYAAQAALAARYQDKYQEFHDAMMAAKGRLTEERVLRIAAAVGLDRERLLKDMKGRKAEHDLIIGLNNRLARDLKINGTPGFVVGDVVIRGAADYGSFQRIIAELRAKGGAIGERGSVGREERTTFPRSPARRRR